MKEKLVSASINSCNVSVPLPAWGGGRLKRERRASPVVCSLVSLYFADVADSHCVAWTSYASL